MNREADHLDLRLKLCLAGGSRVLEAFDGDDGAVRQLPLVDVAEAAFAEDATAAEVFRRR